MCTLHFAANADIEVLIPASVAFLRFSVNCVSGSTKDKGAFQDIYILMWYLSGNHEFVLSHRFGCRVA